MLTDLGNPEAYFIYRIKVVFMENRGYNVLRRATEGGVNTKNWYRKETDLWAKFGKETPFDRKFSSKHFVKMPVVGRTPSFGRRAVLRLEKEAFGNT
jgi:hypothetical protein